MNGINKNGSETNQQIQLELHADWVPAFIAQEVIFNYILPKNNLSNPNYKLVARSRFKNTFHKSNDIAGCFTYKGKCWQGVKPSNPVATKCGLGYDYKGVLVDACAPCNKCKIIIPNH